MDINIVKMEQHHVPDINNMNDPFPIIGRVLPTFHEGEWSWEEELYAEGSETQFPDDHLDWNKYIEDDRKMIFLAYLDQACIGQIRLVRDWNRFAYIENIAVAKAFRKHHVGSKLLEAAEQWASSKGLIGLSLEAQDDNLIACRFYSRQGFVLGGADTLKQTFNPKIAATLYWYKIFN